MPGRGRPKGTRDEAHPVALDAGALLLMGDPRATLLGVRPELVRDYQGDARAVANALIKSGLLPLRNHQGRTPSQPARKDAARHLGQRLQGYAKGGTRAQDNEWLLALWKAAQRGCRPRDMRRLALSKELGDCWIAQPHLAYIPDTARGANCEEMGRALLAHAKSGNFESFAQMARLLRSMAAALPKGFAMISD